MWSIFGICERINELMRTTLHALELKVLIYYKKREKSINTGKL